MPWSASPSPGERGNKRSARLDMPDVPGILRHSPIAGEFANARDVEDGLVGPDQGAFKLFTNGVLRVEIGQQIGQVEIAVTLVQQRPGNPVEQAWLLGTEEVRGEGVHNTSDLRGVRVILAWVIAAVAPQFLNLLGLQTKNEDVLFADFFHDLDIGPIQRADSQGAVHGKLHITRAGGFGPRHGNVLAEIGCRNDLFGQQYSIIGDEHDFDLTAYARIVIDHLADIVDQFDNLFGGPIPRRSFASEHVGTGHSGLDLVFNEA